MTGTPKFCLARAERALLEPGHGYRVRLEIRGRAKLYCRGAGEIPLRAGDLACYPPRQVRGPTEYSDDIETPEPARPPGQSAVDV